MKKFKEFKSEQQYIAEIGPIGVAIMGAMGLWGAWATFKKVKEKVKGYRESQAEKKANKDAGVDIEIKKIDPDTGEEYSEIQTLTGSDASLDSDGVAKAQKEAQTKYNNLEKGGHKKEARGKIRKELGLGPDDKMTKDLEREGIKRLKDKKKPAETDEPTANTSSPETTGDGEDDAPETGDGEDEKGPVEDPKEAEKIYVDKGSAPDGWEWQRDDEGGKVPNTDNPNKKGQVLTNKDAEAFREKKAAEKERERKAKEGEAGSGVKATATKGMSSQDRMKAIAQKKKKKKKKTTTGTTSAPKGGGLGALAKQQGLSTQRVLNFGEFIAEDLMKDLKLASKSRKDSEITLDDGTEILMDAFTAEILVKYIEGLSSSEKNKTIKQFQRTERAFMKVLVKAQEG